MALDIQSEVDIASAALRLIGDQPITDMNDNSDRGRLCNTLYKTTRDSVLRSHPWNFAVTRATLADATVSSVVNGVTITSFPAFEFQHAYALPNDPYCLRVLYTNFDILNNFSWHWKVEGRFLVTDWVPSTGNQVAVKYIYRNEDVTHYDPLFTNVLIVRFAATLAVPLKGSQSLADRYFQLYAALLQEARSMNGMEGSSDSMLDNDLVWVRRT